MKTKEFRIRASACGLIMGNSGLTEIQSDKLIQLSQKDKRTDKQEKELQSLIYKRDNPELPQTAKSYCEQWLKEQIYQRKKEFSNKYTQKGNITEDNSIDFIAENLGYGMLIKNDQYFENEYITGTPDIILPDLIIDVKNSWDCFTFPLLETELPEIKYFWQAQCYMILANKNNYKVIYTLLDTPENLIMQEAKRYAYQNGYGEVDADLYNEFEKKMTYSNIPNKFKIKTFDINKDAKSFECIQNRVIECRNYIEILKNKFNL